jgi:AraC-like DNA-binding protein
MNVETIIVFVISIQGLFLSLFLFSHDRGNRMANRWLGGYIISYSLFLFLLALEQTFYLEFPHIIGLGYPLIFLVGPSFYLYITFYLSRKNTFSLNEAYHFAPFAVSLLGMIPFLLTDPQSKIQFFESVYIKAMPGLLTVTWLIECVHVFIYSGVAVYILQKEKKSVEIKKSNANQQAVFRWLYRLSIGNLLVWSGYIAVYLNFLIFDNIDPNSIANSLFIIFSSLFIYLIGYIGWRQPEFFSADEVFLRDLQASPAKYERSGLTKNQKKIILAKLIEKMREDKLYLNSDLTLNDLADSINISPNYVSQVINEEQNQNFFDFVNAYRIEEARKQLTDPAKNHLSVLGIAEESGFKAKSTFNKVFKELTDTTPSQYRKQQQKQFN